VFPDAARHTSDLVATGGDWQPGTLLSAYRAGLFPMPLPDLGEIGWFSPVERAVLPIHGLRVTRSMRQARRRFEVSLDQAFGEVVAGCADPARPGGWIDDAVRAGYEELHTLGWAHSLEVWRDGRLAGGLYGLAIGGLFCGESMFHVDRDASKVALMHLVRLLDDGVPGRLLDVQWATPHLTSLGVVVVGRTEYLRRLRHALALPVPDLARSLS
jgi:leucyl/phenylalanyl-tRNA--protein transferase